MTQEQLIVAQSEAFTILRDLMHMKPDDPRPQRIINTIKQAALAILRLKPLSHQGEDNSTRQRGAGEGGPRNHAPSETPQPKPETRTPEPADATSHLTDAQFAELLRHLPDSLDPTTDKRRLRLARYLARYQLGVTPAIKEAIRCRARMHPAAVSRDFAAPSIHEVSESATPG